MLLRYRLSARCRVACEAARRGAGTGERSAIIYSVIESCRRRGIDPHTYLAEVLKRIPDATTGDIKELTPAGWAKAQQASRLPAAA